MYCNPLVVRFSFIIGLVFVSPSIAQSFKFDEPHAQAEDFLATQINTDFSGWIEDSSSSLLNLEAQPVKSDQDKRDYRYLVLANQLRVLLISDKKVEASAAAINVGVGANQNPDDRLGLAHFLEHMLFLGTKKYPLPGEYQQFISQQGGSYNASTGAENTQFYFTIKHQAFEQALDRFSQFFISPLFNEVYVDRERNAVTAEFSTKLRDDYRREWDVYRELMNQQHPSAKFTVGNKETLMDKENDHVRDDLIEFYQTHYSAEKMTLVLLSNQPLTQMQLWAEKMFSAIPNHKTADKTPYPSIFDEGFLPARVEIKPEKELRQLTFSFPVPQSKQLLLNKPYDYIAHILGHESKGSLLSILKSLGWAEKLNVGLNYASRDDALFQVTIQLTPTGVRVKDQIISLLFFVLKEIRVHGIEEWRYQELHTMGENQFRYDEKSSPMETVAQLAQNMQDYPVQEILRGKLSYAKFDEEELRESLGYLRADNVLMALIAPEVQPWRLTHTYSVPYNVKKDIPEILDIRISTKQEFSLPRPNLFIPERLVVKSGSLLDDGSYFKASPDLIVEKDHIKIWYQQDSQFNRPQSAVNLHLIVPPSVMTVDRSAMNYLLSNLLRDQLNDTLYYAELMGLEVSLEPHARGIDLSVFGFSNRQSLLLNYVMEALEKPDITETRFTRIKSELLRSWANEEKNLPYQVMINQLPSLLVNPKWSASEMYLALDSVSFSQFSQFARQFLWDVKIEGLIYGNYMPQEAIKLSAIIEHGLQTHQTGRKVSESEVILISDASTKPWLYKRAFSHDDKLVVLYIQAPSEDSGDAAKMQLIRQILQPEFFHQIRTEKQMGYVVANISLPLRQYEGGLFLVQSPNYSENEIVRVIDDFLNDKKKLFNKEFLTQKDSLLQKLQEPARSVREQNARYWESILNRDYQFDRRQHLIDALQKLTFNELNDFYNQVFLNKNRRLWMTSSGFSDDGAYQQVFDKLLQPDPVAK